MQRRMRKPTELSDVDCLESCKRPGKEEEIVIALLSSTIECILEIWRYCITAIVGKRSSANIRYTPCNAGLLEL